MDFVLEVFDHFGLDRAYASIFPSVATSSIDNLAASASASTSEQAVLALKTRYPGILHFLSGLHGSSNLRYGFAPTKYFPPTSYAEMSIFARDNIVRQSISLLVITTVFGWILYGVTALLSYIFVFDHDNFKHPKYLKNQIRLEIIQAVSAIPVMTALTVPWFVLETQGFSKLYWNMENHGGWQYLLFSLPLFLVFTDALIYCIHRWLHWPSVYKHLHKPHHKWIVPTPFASHAFHPVDGYLQSLPYHIFPFFFPLQKLVYLALFGFVNVWTVLIHDGEYLAHDPVVNGSACHTIHHLYFNYNYGQYTTLWDRLGGTHRTPDRELFDPSLKKSNTTYQKQVKQMEEILHEVEGEDDRVYSTTTKQNKTISKR